VFTVRMIVINPASGLPHFNERLCCVGLNISVQSQYLSKN